MSRLLVICIIVAGLLLLTKIKKMVGKVILLALIVAVCYYLKSAGVF